MSQKFLVSIIISAFNAEKYIASTLDSVLQQTYPNVEIIVVNDGSTDTTLSVLESYSHKIKIITQVNNGQASALNLGFKLSAGDYVKFMDSDDLINSDMIELQVNAISSSNNYIAYGEWARFYFDNFSNANFESLDYWKNADPIDFITARPEGIMLQCGIMLIPRQLINKVGGWDERLTHYNDTEFFNRIILASNGVKFVKGARLYYRSGMYDSLSAQNGKKHFESTLLAIDLIAKQLLEKENSNRIKTFISNQYLDRYFHLYPLFPVLCEEYKLRLKQYSFSTIKIQGGIMFKLLKYFLGWKLAKRIQLFFYTHGYKPNYIKQLHS